MLDGEGVAGIAVEAGDFAKVWIGTIEPESRQFKMVAAHGGDPLFFQALERELSRNLLAGKGLTARAIATLQPAVSNDAAGDPEVLVTTIDFTSTLTVSQPLLFAITAEP